MNITIDTVYPDKDSNPYLIAMFQIITFRKQEQNKLIFIPKKRKHKHTNYIECRRHHIIPKCYYRFFNEKIDNSENNLVCVTLDEHTTIHQLLAEYYSTQHTHFGYYMYGCNFKAANLTGADNKTYKLSKTNKEIWDGYTEQERQTRINNISIGTKQAMALIPEDVKQNRINRAAITLSKNCAQRSVERQAELHVNYGKYHIGSKAMSNDLTHHWRYVSLDEQEKYLQNGYVFGNHSKDWIQQGYVKISKGHYALQ